MVECAKLSSYPLDTEPFGDPTTVFSVPLVPGGCGARRFLRSGAEGSVTRDAGMLAGATDDGLDLTADDVTTLPLLLPGDITGTYDFLQCSCVDLLSMGIYTQTQSSVLTYITRSLLTYIVPETKFQFTILQNRYKF